MKNIGIALAVVGATSLGVVAVVGCGSKKDSGTTVAAPTIGTLALMNSAQEAAPRVRPAGSSLNLLDTPSGIGSGSLLAIYQLIREFQSPRDQGVVDGSNMWNAIYNASQNLSTGYGSNCDGKTSTGGAGIASPVAETALTPPFSFGDDSLFAAGTTKFTCKYTSATSSADPQTPSQTNNYRYEIASRKDGEVISALIGMAMKPGASTNYSSSLMEVISNSTTGDIKINSGYGVKYDATGESYNVRLYIRGNTTTGLFSLKLMKSGYNTTMGNTYNIITGYGYAKGSDKYYAFKYDTATKPVGGSVGSLTTAYYCIPSTATLENLQSIYNTVGTTVGGHGSSFTGTGCSDSSYTTGLSTVATAVSGTTLGAFTPTTTEVVFENFTGTGDGKIGMTW